MNNHSTADVAVLFDLDGTLVDSQDAETLALQRFAAQFGVELSRVKSTTWPQAGACKRRSICCARTSRSTRPRTLFLERAALLPRNSSMGAFDVFPVSTPRSARSTIRSSSYRTLLST